MSNGEGFHIDLELNKYTGGHNDPFIHDEYVNGNTFVLIKFSHIFY